jgi:Cdc6-like AAA superfamily ATPase
MADLRAREVIQWLRDTNPELKQRHLATLRSPGTGEWFLQSPEFQRWIADEQQTLFCTGRPGSGKSVMTSLVIDTLYDTFQDEPGVGIAFYYCDYRENDQEYSKPIRSILG